MEIFSKILEGIDNIFTSDEERAEARNKLMEIMKNYDEKTGKINLNESSGNMLQRSWRPLLAMVCVVAFGYSTIIVPIFGLDAVDLKAPQEMLYYLLGYSGLRTFEKIKGVIK